MDAATYKKKPPAYTAFLVAPPKSGKTVQLSYFPGLFYVGTDPTGLDCIFHTSNPKHAALAANFVEICPLTGLDPDVIFADTDEENETSIYGVILKAERMAKQGLIRTFALDNLTYLIESLRGHIKIDQAKDVQNAWGQLGRTAYEIVMSRILGLTRYGINVVIAVHIQRESKQQVEGMDEAVARNQVERAVAARSKRHVNTNSDISPQALGGIRQILGGMTSTNIYLDRQMGQDSDGKEGMRYYALCDKQFYPPWDTEVDAGNRYGLPARIDVTDKGLYVALRIASKKAAEVRAQSSKSSEGGNPPSNGEAAVVETAGVSPARIGQE